MDRRTLLFVLALMTALFFFNRWFFSDKEVPKTPLSTETSALHQTGDLAFPAAPHSPKEEFYVLENAYQQLVFSNLGGALAEINLPLRGKETPESPVRPIEFDRIIQHEFPQNDHFPSFPYLVNDGQGTKEVKERSLGGYYPLLRRAIFRKDGSFAFQPPSKFYAFNIVSDAAPGAHNYYTLKSLEKDRIELEFTDDQRKITKVFQLPKDPNLSPYCVDVSIRVEGDSKGLWMASGVPEVELISENPAPGIKYRMIGANQKGKVTQISLPKEVTTFNSIYPQWVCNSNGFFGLIIDPLTEIGAGFRAKQIPGNVIPTRLTLIDAAYALYPADKYPGYETELPLRTSAMQFRLYAGPLSEKILKRVDETYTDPNTGYSPNYTGALSFHGWFTFISEPFAQFLFIIMKFCYLITSSWGISIVLLTIALRIMLYPLNGWSIKSMKKMQEIGPKVAQIQEKYKKDPKRAQMEVMGLYREKGVNPLSGCFPLLIQLPFLIGMFDLLKSTFELRGAPFIPGWIDNLTAPDVLFSWNYPLIFFGTDFHLLPFLLGGVMWLQQKLSSTAPKDPKMMTDQQKQQKVMGNIMTIVFTVMFYHFPSGLNIYWLSSMLLGILQQWVMTRKKSDVEVLT
ncbi:MAG: membrane protein insertase YidC [Verrucomicrobia bacterium]|nr:membrane protein insertase YidC [Verrucomicrobiota bacterium]